MAEGGGQVYLTAEKPRLDGPLLPWKKIQNFFDTS